MILSILILGGIMIASSVIAGLLTLYQIRTVYSAANSAKAIFAADTGIEVASWCLFKGCTPNSPDDPPTLTFEDKSVKFSINSNISGDTLTIISEGTSGGTLRVLEAFFQ